MIQTKKVKIPHTYVLLFCFIVFVALLTWIVPSGEFDTIKNLQGKMVVVADSYHHVTSEPQNFGAVLMAPIKGMVAVADIVAFILIVGGVFGIIQKTGAIHTLITMMAKKLYGKEIYAIPVMMTLFSVAGAVFGMSEEVIPFVILFIPFAYALGYDSLVGMAIPYVGAHLGFAGAVFNPFTVGVAQGIAGLHPFSGAGFRIFCWGIITATGIAFVMLYAHKIKKQPKKSIVYNLDRLRKKEFADTSIEEADFTLPHKLVMLVFVLGMGLLIFGVMKWGWYIEEICALFTGVGLTCGLVGRMKTNEIAESFIHGAKDLCAAAIVVGLARGILIIAQDGKIIDTILYYLSNLASDLPAVISAWVMFMVQTCINFFIPSGSGQAALTIPIMAPLGDLIGVTRQVTILAYQFGDGFTNMIIPTGPVLLGCLFMARIPWSTWARWMVSLQAILIAVGCILLSLAVLVGFGA